MSQVFEETSLKEFLKQVLEFFSLVIIYSIMSMIEVTATWIHSAFCWTVSVVVLGRITAYFLPTEPNVNRKHGS